MELENIQYKRISSGKTELNSKSIGSHRKNRLIYLIDFNISRSDLQELIENCDLDAFFIDSTSFIDVKEYLKIIDIIREVCSKLNKFIGIIVELRCRKIKIENFVNTNYIKLQKGNKISIITDRKQDSTNNQLVINTKELHRMVKINDKIIINDNKGCFTVHNIKEYKKIRSKTRRNSNENFNGKLKFKNSLVDGLFSESKDNKVSESFKVNKFQLSTFNNNDNFLDIVNEELLDDTIEHQNKGLIPKVLTYQNLHEDLEIIDETENYFKDEVLSEEENNYFYEQNNETNNNEESAFKKSKNFSNKFLNFVNLDIHQQFLKGGSNTSTPKKIKKKENYEIVCSVDYDCIITNQSFMYIPNLDYKKFEMDLLSTREIAEIALLEEKGIDYLCISVVDHDDIESLKEILSENTQLKLIFSIPDLRTLDHIDELLTYASGIIVSRTFHITKINYQTDIILIKKLVQKCRFYGKPIFSFVDLNQSLLVKRKQKFNELKDVMYNLIDGMDGFVLSIFSKERRNSNSVKKLIRTVSNFFREIEENNLFLKEFTVPHIDSEDHQHIDSLCTLIKLSAESFEKSLILYYGDDIKDIENISKNRYNAGLIAISTDISFLNCCKLYYGFESLKIDENLSSTKIEEFINKTITNRCVLLVTHKDKKLSLRLIFN